MSHTPGPADKTHGQVPPPTPTPQIPWCYPAGLWGSILDKAVRRLGAYPFSPLFVRSDVTFEMPRIFTAYSGDISGRYIEFFSLYRQMGFPCPALPGLVRQVLSAQQPSGYFGEAGFDANNLTEKETKIFWGNGRLLIGLMEYYRLTEDGKVLAAAKKLGDFLFDCGLHEPGDDATGATVAHGGPAGFATTFCSCIEGIVRLFEVTRDVRYAGLAKGIADQLPDTLDGFHSHGRMTALRGMVDLSLATGDSALMDRVIGQWALIATEHLVPLGGVREHFGESCHRDEGCSVADWIMLSLKLFNATGAPKYREAAGHCFFNHLLTSQFDNGGFGHQALLPEEAGNGKTVLTGIGLPYGKSPGGFKEAYWCCSFHVPRALLEMARLMVTTPRENAVAIHLPLSAEFNTPGLDFRMVSDEFMKSLEVTVLKASPAVLELRVDIPTWANHPGCKLIHRDGTEEAVGFSGNAFVVSRTWKPGDRLFIGFNPGLLVRSLLSTREKTYATDKQAVFFGPLILGYECSDDLLHGQMMTHGHVTAKLLLIDGHPKFPDPGIPLQMIVEYHDTTNQRTIWSPRQLIPAFLRHNDHNLRVIHTIEHRAFSALNAAQQEELSSGTLP